MGRDLDPVSVVTGDADFELVVAASDPAAYDAFMSRLLAAHPHVQRFTTRVVMGVLKRGLAVPLPLALPEA